MPLLVRNKFTFHGETQFYILRRFSDNKTLLSPQNSHSFILCIEMG